MRADNICFNSSATFAATVRRGGRFRGNDKNTIALLAVLVEET